MDVPSKTDVLELLPAKRATTTANGTGVNVAKYNGLANIILSTDAGGGTTPTLDVTIEESADDVTYAAITGAAFAQVTDAAASFQQITVNLDSSTKFIRAVDTITGTSPTFDRAVIAVAGGAVELP